MSLRWILLALLLGASPASAGRIALWAEGGVAIAESPAEFTDRWKDGVGFAAGVGYRTGPWLEISGAAAMERFGPDGDKVVRTLRPELDLTNATYEGGDATVIFLGGEARVFLPVSLSRVSMWLSGAGGFWRRTYEVVAIEVTTDEGTVGQDIPIPAENEMAVGVGGGLGIRVSREVWFTLETRYRTTLTADDQTRIIPVRIGFAYR